MRAPPRRRWLNHPNLERVPDDVRTAIRAATGVDVDTVHRGPEVGDEAKRLGAIAFAREGAVFVPDEVGPLDRPPGRAVVAHEVAHAAQQRLKPERPGEDTPAGAALEAEAQVAERYFRGDSGAHHPAATGDPDGVSDDDSGIGEAHALMRRLVGEGFAVSDGSGGIVFDGLTRSEPGVQRQTAPAPLRPAPSSERDWNPFETLAHQVHEEATTFSGEVVSSEFGVDLHNEVAESLNASEREFASGQYRQLRLIHRKNRFAAEHGQAAVGHEDEISLAQDVDREVQARLDELERRVDFRVQAMNTDPAGEGVAVLPAEEYRRLVRRLFGDAATDRIPADESSDLRPRTAGLQGPTPLGGRPGVGAPASVPGSLGSTAGPGSSATSPGGATSAGMTTASKSQRVSTSVPPGSGRAPTGASRELMASGPEPANPAGAGVGRRLHQLAGRSGAELLGLYTDEVGVQLSQDEWQQVRRDLGADAPLAGGLAVVGSPAGAQPSPASATNSGAGAGSAVQSPRHGTRQVGSGGPGDSTIGPGGHEHLDLDHLDLDELTDRIYGRMRRRLRMELLVDRERAGLLTDFR